VPDRVTGIPAPGTSVGATGLPEAGAVTGAGRPTGARRTLRAQDVVVVDPGACLVYVGGVAITMPRKEMELLSMLVGASGTIVSREELATAAWGEAEPLPCPSMSISGACGDGPRQTTTIRRTSGPSAGLDVSSTPLRWCARAPGPIGGRMT